jgi:DNA-binding GntR family transcriptional regulator
MSRPTTFDRVYAALKIRLREGFFRPGERLEPAALSEEVNASVTPVRDALHRLTGERLVEAPHHEGFRTPLLTETMLRHLYGWHRDLVILAVAKHADHQLKEALADKVGLGDAPTIQNQIFLALARSTGNPEHAAALESLIERLAPVRRLEEVLLDAVEQESADILAALADKDRRRLRRTLIRYYRRRERIVPELLERVYAR